METTKSITFKQAKSLVRKARIQSVQKYIALRKKNALPVGLPDSPRNAFPRYWKGWDDFCGLK